MKNKRKFGGIMVLASFLIAGMISNCGGKTPDNPARNHSCNKE